MLFIFGSTTVQSHQECGFLHASMLLLLEHITHCLTVLKSTVCFLKTFCKYQCLWVECFQHDIIQSHNSASYALSYQTTFCQTVSQLFVRRQKIWVISRKIYSLLPCYLWCCKPV